MFWVFGQEACKILAPWPGLEPALPTLEGEVSTMRPLEKSPEYTEDQSIITQYLLSVHAYWWGRRLDTTYDSK